MLHCRVLSVKCKYYEMCFRAPMRFSTLAGILVQSPRRQHTFLWDPHMIMEMGWMNHPLYQSNIMSFFQRSGATIWCLEVHLVFGVLACNSMVPT